VRRLDLPGILLTAGGAALLVRGVRNQPVVRADFLAEGR
jgi:hypothetical protein